MKKILSLLMATVLVFALGTTAAFAESGEPADGEVEVDTSLVDSVDSDGASEDGVMPINEVAPETDPDEEAPDAEAPADGSEAAPEDAEEGTEAPTVSEPDPVADDSQVIGGEESGSGTVRLAIIGIVLLCFGGGALLYSKYGRKKR